MRKKSDYAVYKGDTFLFLGTTEECAEYFNVKIESIKFLLTPSGRARYAKRKRQDKAITVVNIGPDEEEKE